MKTWAEAEIIDHPIKDRKEPVVLVRRKTSDLIGTRGEQLVYLPGEPVISLFTGAGGMDIGIERAGFCTLLQHEHWNIACETLIANRPEYFRWAALIQGDIYETPTSMMLIEAGLRVGEAALVCGGPPCQGFSTANSKATRGESDTRNDLVFEFLRVVNEAKPKHFLMENVPGFLTFPGKKDGKSYPELFLKAAYECYYELVYGIIDAVNFGVPQHRPRFLCMGTRRDIVDADNIIAGLPAPHTFGDEDLRIIRAGQDEEEIKILTMAPGVRYFPDRPVLLPPAPNYGQKCSETYKQFYRKLKEKEPDRIITVPGRGEDKCLSKS
jgi:DNA (cytosine-5)-methyltransferase 1